MNDPIQSHNDPNSNAGKSAYTLPIVEEIAIVSSKTIETGRVVISKKVEDHQEAVHVVSAHDETDVERVTLNRIVDAAPAVRYEGETMIIPVLKEVAVVEKKLLLVEEIRVTKRKVQTQETVPVTLRKERIEIIREKVPNASGGPESGKVF